MDETFTFTIKASRVLNGPDVDRNRLGRAIAERIATEAGDIALTVATVDGPRVSFFTLTSIDFDREELGEWGEP